MCFVIESLYFYVCCINVNIMDSKIIKILLEPTTNADAVGHNTKCWFYRRGNPLDGSKQRLPDWNQR